MTDAGAAADYDVLIIGAGQAGVPLAYALAEAGKKVALAERKDLGGSCVNFGCTPTKAAIASARLAHQARRAAEFGVRVPVVEVDFAAVLARARRIALASRAGIEKGFAGTQNPRLLRGHARLEGRFGAGFRVRVGEATVRAGQVVLNPGTRSLVPDVQGLAGLDFIHSGNWLENTELPEHLAIMGGGYIGLEMGQFYRRMGSAVTVVGDGPEVAAHEDPEVSAALRELLEAEGVVFRLSSRVSRVRREGGDLVLTVDGHGRSSELRASHLFVATGRTPNTDDLGLETVGVKLSDRGIVEADERLATSVPGVWVAGDARGGPMFTHTSWDDYRVLVSQLLGDGSHTTHRVVPYGIFTDPELGRVGMTEREARETGRPVKAARYDLSRNGKASEIGETTGFVKVVVDGETDQILGAAVLAAEGAELVHTYIALMNARAPYTVTRDSVHIHPTLSEAIQSVLKDLG